MSIRLLGENSQSDHFLDNRLNPSLKHGILCAHAIDGRLAGRLVIQVGLMKHEWVMMEPKQMTGIGVFLDR